VNAGEPITRTGTEPDFRMLFESSPGLVVALAPDFSIVAASDSYLVATGAIREDVVGRTIFDTLGDVPNAAVNLRASLVRVIETRRADAMGLQERHIRTSDGRTQIRTWRLQNIPLLSPTGALTCILHHVEDVTQTVALEAFQSQLARAQDAAEKSARALEAFNHSVAHDLRSPILILDGISQALLEDYTDALDDTGKRYLTFVRDSARRLAQMVNDLLALSRISSRALVRERVDLTQLAQHTIADLHAADPERRVEWLIHEHLVDNCDPQLLTIVLHNLLHNAWKFSGKRELARIEFGAVMEGRSPQYFVRDNGAGFDMTHAHRLFGVFQRLHASADYPGSGVGLAAVERVIHRHNGRVWANADNDRGATFYFTLNETSSA
jgi:PAS domain S-box-containing protein